MKKIFILVFVICMFVPNQSFARLLSDCGYDCFIDYDSIVVETKFYNVWIAKAEIENHDKKQTIYIKKTHNKMFVSKTKTYWHEPETFGPAGPILCIKVNRYIEVFK